MRYSQQKHSESSLTKSTSKKPNTQNYTDPQVGQSLFSYLKRKRKGTLDSVFFGRQTISNGYNTERESQQNQQKRNRSKQDYKQKDNGQAFVFPDALTPGKKASFASNFHQSRKEKDSMYRDALLIDMVSPIKNNVRRQLALDSSHGRKSAIITRDYPETRQTTINNTKKNSLQKISSRPTSTSKLPGYRGDKQSYTLRLVNTTMVTLQQSICNLISTGFVLKQKSHSLFIQLNPLLRAIQDQSANTRDKNMKKYIYCKFSKLSDVRDDFRVFQNNFSKFDLESPMELFEKLKKQLMEHLDGLEGDIRQEFQREVVLEVDRIRNGKEIEIQQLRNKVQSSLKLLDLEKRKVSKLQEAIQNNNGEREQQQVKFNEGLQVRVSNYEERIESQTRMISELEQTLSCCRQQIKVLQKQLKSRSYQAENLQTQFQRERELITSTRQQYLLNQIMMLKEEHSRQVERLSECSKFSTDHYMQTVRTCQQELQECKKRLQVVIVLLEEAKREKGEVHLQEQRLRKMNQGLMTDLRRMNEQMYQHWIALRDVKELGIRLGLFDRFQRIFRDLAYDDRLFE